LPHIHQRRRSRSTTCPTDRTDGPSSHWSSRSTQSRRSAGSYHCCPPRRHHSMRYPTQHRGLRSCRGRCRAGS
jgi:hypothetical protein